MLDTQGDPSQNYLERPPHPLDPFFHPQSVAIIGAKEEMGSVGRTLLVNMMSHFKGAIYPINPKYPEVLGLRAYPKIQDAPKGIDLAVIVTPAHLIPSLIDDCVLAGVKSVVIISAGFKETGEAGELLEKEVLAKAAKGKIKIIGPNCLGLMNPHVGLNATFAANIAKPGHLAFISQSGALCTAVLDWSLREKIGFSGFVSVGSMADVDFGDLIDYFGSDPDTSSILIYMETIGDARKFISAAREVSFNKPIIVIKPGRTLEAAKAAASHTGSLAGADDVFDAAIARAGILRVGDIQELFNMADVLAKQPHPKGPHLAIVTNAGGPAVLATDATILNGAKLSELGKETIEALNTFLPKAWSHNNPVDILGDAGSERYAKTIEVVAKDPAVDGLLVILTPQDMTDPTATAKALGKYSKSIDKPLLASWMGAGFVEEGVKILNDLGIPTFSYPDNAAATFAQMWKQSDYVRLLYETPSLLEKPEDGKEKKEIKALFAKLGQEKRTLLTEEESKHLLSLYGIPVVETFIATSEEEAVSLAEKVGYPIVLKLHSKTITHKSDVGGVKLNIRNKEGVLTSYQEIKKSVSSQDFEGVTVQKMIKLSGYELIIGSIVDPQFGPIVLFGSGGVLVEVLKDRALGMPPFTETLARRLMASTKIYEALQGIRGKKAVDLKKLEEILVRFSRLIVELPQIKEFDINPLIASPEGIIALDARIVLHDPSETLPKPAIRPYPIQYVSHVTLKSGKKVTLRPIRPEDEPHFIEFHQALSQESIRSRYFEFLSLEERIAHERLSRICNCDYERDIALVGEIENKIVSVARLSKIYGTSDAEFKMTIIDSFQKKGLGKQMFLTLLEIARQEHIEKIYAHILKDNTGMLHIAKNLGFTLQPTEKNPSIILAEKKLDFSL